MELRCSPISSPLSSPLGRARMAAAVLLLIGAGACSTELRRGACESNDDCEFNQICDPGSGQCVVSIGVNVPCTRNTQCPPVAPYCGPGGYCQRGVEADDCVVNADCDPSLFCSTLGRCQDGSAQDPCGHAIDCREPHALCGPFGCQIGDEGDPCSDAGIHCRHGLICSSYEHCQDGGPLDDCRDDHHDCSPSTPFCGPAGCQDGGEGCPCEDAASDCQPGLLCNSLGRCQDGGSGDQCTVDEDCDDATPLCGPLGCQAGNEGEYCLDEKDCDAGSPICRFGGVCQDGSTFDPCIDNDDCGTLLVCVELACEPEARDAWIVFARDNTIWRARANGDHEEMIAQLADGLEVRGLAVSPDGGQVAYLELHGELDTANRIVLMNIDGSRSREVINTGGDGASRLCAFHPDGTRLLYQMDVSPFDGKNDELFEVSLDGSSNANLTQHVNNEGCGDYSPSGQQIVFESSPTSCDDCGDLFAMDADGTGRTLIFDPDGGSAGSPAWSPNGSRIVVSARRPGENADLYAMDPDGSNAVNLTNTPMVEEGEATWSRSGDLILYEREGGLWVVEHNGRNPRMLISEGRNPAWARPLPLRPGCRFSNVATPVAYYPLDETSGTRVTDASGNDSHATSGAAVAERGLPGVLGTAYRLDSLSSPGLAILLDGSTTLSMAQGTVELWAWIDDTAAFKNHRFVAVNPPGCDDSLILQRSFADNTEGRLALSGGETCGIDESDTPLPTGQWVHVAASWGPSGRYAYVNGVLAAEDPTNAHGVAGAGDHGWYIGGDGPDLPGMFVGLLDEVCIYDTQLPIGDQWPVGWQNVDFTAWQALDANPALERGFSGGAFDVLNIRSATALFDEPAGEFQLWYTGMDNTNRGRIGYATSQNGDVWTPCSTSPVIDYEHCGVADWWHAYYPTVIRDGDSLRMWYAGDSYGHHSICHTTSTDGITWDAATVVFDGQEYFASDEGWARATGAGTVLRDGDTYKMWYFHGSAEHDSPIGYATSADGLSWTIVGPVFGDGAADEWDGELVTHPSVVKLDGMWHMFYIGRASDTGPSGIGLATSDDGIHWTRHPDNPIITVDQISWSTGGLEWPRVFREGNHQLMLWIVGHDGVSTAVGQLFIDAEISR